MKALLATALVGFGVAAAVPSHPEPQAHDGARAELGDPVIASPTPSFGAVTPIGTAPPTVTIPATTTLPAPTTSTTIVVTTTAPPPPPPPPQPSETVLAALRDCEAAGDYAAHLVDGTPFESTARGGYQFEQATWDGVASRHNLSLLHVDPSTASPDDQDQMARWLWQERGSNPWPVCGPRALRKPA